MHLNESELSGAMLMALGVTGKLSKHGDVQEEAWTVQCQHHGSIVRAKHDLQLVHFGSGKTI